LGNAKEARIRGGRTSICTAFLMLEVRATQPGICLLLRARSSIYRFGHSLFNLFLPLSMYYELNIPSISTISIFQLLSPSICLLSNISQSQNVQNTLIWAL
jgi:hypothetical protein